MKVLQISQKLLNALFFFDKSFNPGGACGLGRLSGDEDEPLEAEAGEFPAFKPASELFIAAVWAAAVVAEAGVGNEPPPTRLIRVDKSQHRDGILLTLHSVVMQPQATARHATETAARRRPLTPARVLPA